MSETEKPVILVVGARPNFMKIAPLHSELEKRGVRQVLVHTGQHYDEKMSKVFFQDLGLPSPDVYLGVGSASHASQTAKIMVEFEKICINLGPQLVVVVGDVNSTLACTLVAAKLNIKTAHVEAGLRSNDRKMPEEINRIVTDSLADILLTPSKDGNENLRKEGVADEKVHFVGNIMIDSLFNILEKSRDSEILRTLGLEGSDYGIVTLHRPSNVDDKEAFTSIVGALEKIGEENILVFPMHPRTKKNSIEMDLIGRIEEVPRIKILGPLGYLDFTALLASAKFALTDSGGLQEETTALGIPCITIRENTERPITISEGTNRLVGSEMNEIIKGFSDSMDEKIIETPLPENWDGKTAVRIADIIVEEIE